MILQREVLLVSFPFSNQTGTKVRPVLVLSNNEFNETNDIIVCAITSNIMKEKYTVLINPDEMEEGILYQQSSIKAENLLKVEKSLIIKKIGKIKRSVLIKVLAEIDFIFRE